MNIKDQLTLHEGAKKFPYVDTVGKISIGIGRNLTDVGVSQAVIDLMFQEDLDRTLEFLTTKCPWFVKLDKVRQRAVTDMAFNLMNKILTFQKMISHIEKEEWDEAADEILNSHFATQTGIRATHIAHMIRTGNDF